MKPNSPHDLTLLHGVFLSVSGMGILLSGNSGIGKSELALGLINRNHRLVADDSVEFYRHDNKIIGQCPAVLQDFIEVRGLGILNIRAIFGDKAIIKQTNLDLIIHLREVNQQELYQIDRLHGVHSTQAILGQDIPEVCLPVAPGRNLAILVECAVKNHALKLNGYHAVDDFTDRHNNYMKQMGND